MPTIDDTATQLIDVAARLHGLMLRETDLLRGMRAREITEILPQKEALVNSYRRLIDELRMQPEALRDMPKPRRNALRHAASTVAAASVETEYSLAAAIAANHRLFDSVAEAIRAQQTEHSGYAPDGRKDARIAAADAVSLNTTL